MVKRILSAIIVAVLFVTLVAPELSATLSHSDADVAATLKAEIKSSTSTDFKVSDLDCSGVCGDANHVSHHCHFGHCGILSEASFEAALTFSNIYGDHSTPFTLRSFRSNLYRPPIV